MKTWVSTTIEHSKNVQVEESIEEIKILLKEKGNFIYLNKMHFNDKKNKILIRKTCIKVVRTE